MIPEKLLSFAMAIFFVSNVFIEGRTTYYQTELLLLTWIHCNRSMDKWLQLS